MPLGFAKNIFSLSTTASAVTYPTGGVQFSRAVNERINITNLGNLPNDNPIYHFSAWIKLDSVPSGSGVVYSLAAYSNSGDNNFPFYCLYRTDTSHRFQIGGHYRVGFSTYNVNLSSDLETDRWYHIICKQCIDDTSREFWLDGVRINLQSRTDSGYLFPINNSEGLGSIEQFTIGATTVNNSSFANHWDGCIEQLYWKAGDIDITSNLSKFYDNGFVDMGTDGTGSGLSQPTFFHQGSSQAVFDNLGGSATGTATVNGTLTACS